MRANIVELRGRLESERTRIAGSLGVNNSVNLTRVEDLRRSLDDQRAKVIQIKTLRDEALVLQRDVENAQRAFDAGFNRKSMSALESQATQTNVSVIRQATPPPFPSSPRTTLNLLIGLVLGLAFGVLTAVVRERRDWRIRVDDDVLEGLRYPLLGVMPDVPREGPRSAAWRPCRPAPAGAPRGAPDPRRLSDGHHPRTRLGLRQRRHRAGTAASATSSANCGSSAARRSNRCSPTSASTACASARPPSR